MDNHLANVSVAVTAQDAPATTPARTMTPKSATAGSSVTPSPPVSKAPVELPEPVSEFSLRDYWRVLHARRGTIAWATALSLGAALAYNYVITPTYRARGTLQIDREEPNIAELDENYRRLPEQPDYLETQYKVLKSRALGRRVIAKLGLHNRAEFRVRLHSRTTAAPPANSRAAAQAPGANAAAGETGDMDAAVHPAIVAEYLDHLGVHPAKGTHLVDVTFESVYPALAAGVVDTLAEEYIEHNLEAKWNATQKASTWLEQQLSTLQAALEASESELVDYAARHSILFVEERKNITTEKLAQFESSLTAAAAERIQEQSRDILVQDAIARGGELPGSLTSEMYQQLQATLTDLKREHSQLLVTFAPGYPSVQRVRRQIEQLDAALAIERKRILGSVTESFQLASRREELLRKEVLKQRALVNRLSDDFIQYDILKRDAESNRQLYEGLLQRLKEAGVSAGLRASNIAILDRAELPERPYRPKQLLNATLGLLGGLLLGAAVAFVQEHMSTLVRTPEEVERMTGLSLLAVIPRSRSKDSAQVITEPLDPLLPAAGLPVEQHRRLAPLLQAEPGQTKLGQTEPGQSQPVNAGPSLAAAGHNAAGQNGTANATVRDGPSADAADANSEGEMCWRPEPALSEAYRTLRSSVLLGLDESMRRILVTSSQPQEGKTTVSLNLACSLAQLRRRVLLIDADMRRPNCAKQLHVETDTGLTDYLQGLAKIEQVVTRTRMDGLWLAAAGRSNAVASDLLYSPRLATLLCEAGKRFDHIVIDSPPSLVLSDARTISRMVEGVIMVVSDSTESGALMRTKQTFDEAGVHFLGFVMNRVDLDNLDYGYYRDYGYYYPYSDEKNS